MALTLSLGVGCAAARMREDVVLPPLDAAPSTDATTGMEASALDAGLEAALDAPQEVSADATVAPDGASEGGDAAPALRVLFVGNSYTYVNDLPNTVRALGAATPGGAVDVDMLTVGGATLQDHWNDTSMVSRITTGGFARVVLQGQSVEPLSQPSVFQRYATLLAGAVRDGGAQPVWYATWARRAGDPIYSNPGLTPDTMTRGLEAAYQQAARDGGGVVARVGAAWQLALAEQPEVVLYADDGSHPSPAGTLLAACVMLQALTGLAPVVPEPPPLGVPSATARSLCALAARVR